MKSSVSCLLDCRPRKYYAGSSTWYEAVPVGKNKLGSMVKDMCSEAGVELKTNHSLTGRGEYTGKIPFPSVYEINHCGIL